MCTLMSHESDMPQAIAEPTTVPQQGPKLTDHLVQPLEAKLDSADSTDPDFSTLKAIFEAIKSGTIDDRTYSIQQVLVGLSRLTNTTAESENLKDSIILFLYNDLEHPPPTFLGREYQFRTPDGSHNNVNTSDLGKAGSPYTRSVQSVTPIPVNEHPDSGLLFDTLLKRDKPQPHPSGLSSLFIAFSLIITQSIFKTDPNNHNINGTSSYLDLAPLYGNSLAEQQSIRIGNGMGLVKPDTFADKRVLSLPPPVAALLVLWSRHHNYLATFIFQINEHNTYKNPANITDKAALAKQDDEIFNRARLVNSAHFANVVLRDYVGAILGLTNDGSTWTLDPLKPIRKLDHEFAERGRGNAVSVEFNLLYRWNATISEKDSTSAEDQLPKTLKEKIFQNISGAMNVFTNDAAKTVSRTSGDGPPETWTFGGLKRQAGGSFDDNQLAGIVQGATTTVANSFGARGSPESLKSAEISAIQQAREWGVGTLNEFRAFFGLKAYSTFEEWNSNEDIASAARNLYGDINSLELYVGLHAEETIAPGPGVALCSGPTVFRALLGEIVSLTRGDRFLTADLTPNNLTAWGFQDIIPNVANGAFGNALPKILFRALPNNYRYNSVTALFPFYTPDTISNVLKNLDGSAGSDNYKKYDFSVPQPGPQIVPLSSWNAVTTVLDDNKTFATTYGESMGSLTNGHGFFLAYDDPARHDPDLKLVSSALFPDKDSIPAFAKYYGAITTQLIEEKSFFIDGNKTKAIDIVGNVINFIPVYWTSFKAAGIPLKTKDTPDGIHSEQEVYTFLSIIFAYIFLNFQPEIGWTLRETALQFDQLVLSYIQGHLKSLPDDPTPPDGYNAFLKRLAASGRSPEELSYNVISTIVGACATFGHAASLVVNFYLDDERAEEKKHIIELSKDNTPENTAKLVAYVREAMRFDPQAPGLTRAALADASIVDSPSDPPKKIQAGSGIFVSTENAVMDPAAFPNPTKIDLTRPAEKYVTFGSGIHTCMGRHFAEASIPEVLRSLFSLKNLRRAPGDSGQLNRVQSSIYGARQYQYVKQGTLSPWPVSLILLYDVDE